MQNDVLGHFQLAERAQVQIQHAVLADNLRGDAQKPAHLPVPRVVAARGHVKDVAAVEMAVELQRAAAPDELSACEAVRAASV